MEQTMFILINDNFSASRDNHGWTLIETQHKTRKQNHPRGKWMKGDPYRATNQTYFGRLEHLCASIIDISAGADSVTSLADVVTAIYHAREDCLKAVNQAGLGV